MHGREFEGIEVLLIDGNNLLHRVSGSVEPGAQRQLLARLRGAVAPTLATVVMLDGHAAAGTSRRELIGRGLEIRHAGTISADDALLRLVADASPAERHSMTVVTDDRSLADRARHLGARTQRLAWLEALLARPSRSTGIGSGRFPRAGGVQGERDGEEEREPWQPGRGATRKRGNPRRRPR